MSGYVRHYASSRGGAECGVDVGHRHFRTTHDLVEVTCDRCRVTWRYTSALDKVASVAAEQLAGAREVVATAERVLARKQLVDVMRQNLVHTYRL